MHVVLVSLVRLPATVVGLPFGVVALVILNQDEVKKAFEINLTFPSNVGDGRQEGSPGQPGA